MYGAYGVPGGPSPAVIGYPHPMRAYLVTSALLVVLGPGCRGAAPDDETAGEGEPDTDVPEPEDLDRDGFAAGEDCDDARADVHPGAAEVCANGLDDDCSGRADEACFAEDGLQLSLDYGRDTWFYPAGILHDLDGDDRDELVVTWVGWYSEETRYHDVWVFAGSTLARVAETGTLDLVEEENWPASVVRGPEGWGDDVAILGDLDGDGLEDLSIWQDNDWTRPHVYTGDVLLGPNHDQDDPWMRLAAGRLPVGLGDVDGDGRGEVGADSLLWLSGSFGAGVELNDEDAVAEVSGNLQLGADLDGDGLAEVLSYGGAGFTADRLEWYDAEGVLAGEAMVSMVSPYEDPWGMASLDDVDGDGLSDVGVAGRGAPGGSIEVFCSGGARMEPWTSCAEVVSDRIDDELEVNFRRRGWDSRDQQPAGDVDGDGHADLWLGGIERGTCFVAGALVAAGGRQALPEAAETCYWHGRGLDLVPVPPARFTRPDGYDLPLAHSDGLVLFAP
jgi:hypothetical protein